MLNVISTSRIRRWRRKGLIYLRNDRFKNRNECFWFWCSECRQHDLPLPPVDITYKRCNETPWKSEEKNDGWQKDGGMGIYIRWIYTPSTAFNPLPTLLCYIIVAFCFCFSLYYVSAWRGQPFLCASRTCNLMYDKCIEESLDQISSYFKRYSCCEETNVSFACHIRWKEEDGDRTPTGADTRTTSLYLRCHFRLT
jgi:hypothetical protein